MNDSPTSSKAPAGAFAPEIHPTFWVDWADWAGINDCRIGLGRYLAQCLGRDDALTLVGAINDTDYAMEVVAKADPTDAYPADPDRVRETGELHVWGLSSFLDWAAEQGHIQPGHWVVTYSF